MNLKAVIELFSLRDLRNAVLGAVVVFGGIGLAIATLYAHQTGNVELAGITAGTGTSPLRSPLQRVCGGTALRCIRAFVRLAVEHGVLLRHARSAGCVGHRD